MAHRETAERGRLERQELIARLPHVCELGITTVRGVHRDRKLGLEQACQNGSNSSRPNERLPR